MLGGGELMVSRSSRTEQAKVAPGNDFITFNILMEEEEEEEEEEKEEEEEEEK